MAAAVSPAVLIAPSNENSNTDEMVVKEQDIHHALTPPASDESRYGDGSRKDHFSDDDSDLSELENVDDLVASTQDVEMPDASNNSIPQVDGRDAKTEPVGSDIYANVQPDRIEGGVPVFCPTMEQFKDFEKYMKAINPYGMKSGIALVDPPEEWKQDRKPLDDKVKTIKVKNPISQAFNGTGGFWTQENMEKQRSYNLPQWKALCGQSEHQPPAQRGTARGGTTTRVFSRNNTTKARPDDDSGNQKKKPGRPRVNALKEEEAAEDEKSDASSSMVAPPTPTSPEHHPEVKDEVADEDTEEPTPTKARGRPGRKPGPKPKGKPGRKPGVKSGSKPGPKSAGAGGASKKTSVASRRMHNQQMVNEEIDEEAFRDFDYHLADIDAFDDERCAQLEQQYWKGLTFSPPMYGADMPGSLFDEDTKVWNVAHLPNVLDLLDKAVPGVNTAYLYLGMWKATFAWHLEDVDLYSINYIHFGAPKQWYSISQADAPRFEKAMKSLWPNDSKYCSQFLRHKTYLISPLKLLNDYGIKVNKVVHREGQFMITYPYGYHSGFNYGYNCAESVNFALEEWLAYAQTSQKCNCSEDSVFIDVHDILRKLHPEDYVDEYQEVTDDEDDEGLADLPTPPSSVKGKPGRKRKRQDDKLEKPAKKTKRIKITRGYQPCVLCPNNHDFDDLILTEDGKLAHRKCATYTVETFIVQENGRDVVKGIGNIHKDKWALQCNFCRQKKGVCFQCHTPKCTRAYHATCAIMAGVQVDEADTPRFYEGVEYKDPIIDLRCKTHRTVKHGRPSTDSASMLQLAKTCSKSFFQYALDLKVNDVIQFQVSHLDSITAAVVVQPHDGSGIINVRLLNQGVDHKETTSIDISWLMFVDASNSTIPRCSSNAKDMPKWVADKLLSAPGKLEAAERLPASGDPFIEGTEQTDKESFFLQWDGFQTRPAFSNPEQKTVDLLKDNVLWHYIGEDSTLSKTKYCSDPARKIHDPKSDFWASLPQPPKPVVAPPVKRVSLPSTHPHPGFPSVQSQQSQAQQNMARRLEELKNNRQSLLQARLQGKQEDQQQPLMKPPVHGAVPSFIHYQTTAHPSSPLRTESPMNSKLTLSNNQQNKHVPSPHPAQVYAPLLPTGQSHSSLSSYQYSAAAPQTVPTPVNTNPSTGGINYPQPAGMLSGNLPGTYQGNLQYPTHFRSYQPPVPDPRGASGWRHQFTDAWKDKQEYQRAQQHQPPVPDQRGTQGFTSSFQLQANSQTPATAVKNAPQGTSGENSTRLHVEGINVKDQRRPEHGAMHTFVAASPSNLPSNTVKQPPSRSFGPQPAADGNVKLSGAAKTTNDARYNQIPNTDGTVLSYQSPYAGNPSVNALPHQVPISNPGNSVNTHHASAIVSSKDSTNRLHTANSAIPQISTSSTQSREVQSERERTTSSPSPPAHSLQAIEKRVHTPGGLRLIAATIQMPYGNLADDLQLGADGRRVRVNGSRKPGQEWVQGINNEEEELLKGKLKKMGIL